MKEKDMAKAKGHVSFDEDRCKGCALCASVCPVKIIAMDTNRINKKGYHPAGVMQMDKCIGCASCALICPDLVITVEKVS